MAYQFSRFCILFILGHFLGTQLVAADLFNGQPKILLEDGNLIFESRLDRNVSFRTRGRGGITFMVNGQAQLNNFGSNNGNDVLTRLTSVEATARTYPDLNERLVALGQRIQQIESRQSFTSQADDPMQAITVLRRQMRRLQTVVRTLRRTLRRDECESNPCHNGGTCIDSYDGYFCQCPDNWEGPTCTQDIDECARFASTDLGCQNGASCHNIPGSYMCHCLPNWYGIHCTESVDSCNSGSHEELCGHGQCSDNNGQRNCICSQGWTKDANGRCTEDVDECATSQSLCSRSPRVNCINVPGSFRCGACPTGYTGDGFFCDDIDECQTGNNGGCSTDPPVPCYNIVGSVRCGPCPRGYQGDGQTCTYMGPCHVANGGCHPMAVCISSGAAGLVQCFCRQGFVGYGVGPMGCTPGSGTGQAPRLPGEDSGVVMSPCASGPCMNGATCIPLATAFVCNCLQGYTGFMCQTQINDCDSSPCSNGGTCINKPIGFECVCTPSYIAFFLIS